MFCRIRYTRFEETEYQIGIVSMQTRNAKRVLPEYISITGKKGSEIRHQKMVERKENEQKVSIDVFGFIPPIVSKYNAQEEKYIDLKRPLREFFLKYMKTASTIPCMQADLGTWKKKNLGKIQLLRFNMFEPDMKELSNMLDIIKSSLEPKDQKEICLNIDEIELIEELQADYERVIAETKVLNFMSDQMKMKLRNQAFMISKPVKSMFEELIAFCDNGHNINKIAYTSMCNLAKHFDDLTYVQLTRKAWTESAENVYQLAVAFRDFSIMLSEFQSVLSAGHDYKAGCCNFCTNITALKQKECEVKKDVYEALHNTQAASIAAAVLAHSTLQELWEHDGDCMMTVEGVAITSQYLLNAIYLVVPKELWTQGQIMFKHTVGPKSMFNTHCDQIDDSVKMVMTSEGYLIVNDSPRFMLEAKWHDDVVYDVNGEQYKLLPQKVIDTLFIQRGGKEALEATDCLKLEATPTRKRKRQAYETLKEKMLDLKADQAYAQALEDGLIVEDPEDEEDCAVFKFTVENEKLREVGEKLLEVQEIATGIRRKISKVADDIVDKSTVARELFKPFSPTGSPRESVTPPPTPINE